MDISTLGTLVSTYGFPMVCCAYLFWERHKSDIRYDEERKLLSKEHKEETDKLTEALNNNTLALTTLVERIGIHG